VCVRACMRVLGLGPGFRVGVSEYVYVLDLFRENIFTVSVVYWYVLIVTWHSGWLLILS